jgi:hypothetical protein
MEMIRAGSSIIRDVRPNTDKAAIGFIPGRNFYLRNFTLNPCPFGLNKSIESRLGNLVPATVGSCSAASAGVSSERDVVAAVDRAKRDREAKLLGYSVQESYALFRRGETKASAEMVVSTTYIKNKGKSYQILRESGSTTGRFVLQKILQNEEQLSEGAIGPIFS